MILNDLDLKILKEFNKLSEDSEKNPTTWDIMMKVYKKKDNLLHTNIKNRIHRMNEDLFFIEKNKKGNYEYTLIRDNVLFSKRKFPSGNKECVMIRSEGKWMIFQL